jgi:hypothetical protein
MAEISGPELRLLDDLLFKIEAEQAKGREMDNLMMPTSRGISPQEGLGETAGALSEALRTEGPMFPDQLSGQPVQRSDQLLGTIYDLLTQQQNIGQQR